MVRHGRLKGLGFGSALVAVWRAGGVTFRLLHIHADERHRKRRDGPLIPASVIREVSQLPGAGISGLSWGGTPPQVRAGGGFGRLGPSRSAFWESYSWQRVAISACCLRRAISVDTALAKVANDWISPAVHSCGSESIKQKVPRTFPGCRTRVRIRWRSRQLALLPRRLTSVRDDRHVQSRAVPSRLLFAVRSHPNQSSTQHTHCDLNSWHNYAHVSRRNVLPDPHSER